jgi:hypothetical protein
MKNIIDDTLKQVNELEPYKVMQFDVDRKIVLNESAIWLIDNVANFFISRENFNFSTDHTGTIRHLFYCRKGSSKEIEEKFKIEEEKAQNENVALRGLSMPHLWTFLYEENGKVFLKSLTMFSPQLCGSLQAIVINEFSVNSQSWLSEDFFAIDNSNFHGCPIVFAPIYFRNDIYQPPVITIAKSLQRSLNFNAEFNPYIHAHDRYNISKRVDFLIMLDFVNDREYFTSFPLATVSYGLTVPFGEPYSPLEKLFWPFGFEVWIMFGLVFFIAFSTVFFIKRFAHHDIGHFVWGNNITTPSLNIFLIFMGGGMMVLPRRNFARYILMCFILFCLVMR